MIADNLISLEEAQVALQFAARRYTVAHEAHGEGKVVWSDNLISVTDAFNALRELPSKSSCKGCKHEHVTDWYDGHCNGCARIDLDKYEPAEQIDFPAPKRKEESC